MGGDCHWVGWGPKKVRCNGRRNDFSDFYYLNKAFCALGGSHSGTTEFSVLAPPEPGPGEAACADEPAPGVAGARCGRDALPISACTRRETRTPQPGDGLL
jgi:hypothetical protein